MLHFYFKALHIIGFVTWFAGLFYLARLFVYHIEAIEQNKSEEVKTIFGLMQRRLYRIITTPGMVVTLIFGIGMLINNKSFLLLPWLHVKLVLVAVLIGYHVYCGKIINQLAGGKVPFDSWRMRLFNELPTILLVSIVFLAVLKQGLNALYGTLGFVLFSILLFVFAKRYKRKREAKENTHK